MNNNFVHTTVLKKETVEHILPSNILTSSLVNDKNNELYFVDATIGGAGHSEYLIEYILNSQNFKQFTLNLIGFDQDIFALNFANEKLKKLKDKFSNLNYYLINKNFMHVKSVMESDFKNCKVHGLLADFGVSSPQLDISSRGFSMYHDGPIDMRMDTTLSESALDILLNYSETELTRIFFEYGEEPKSRKLSKAIIEDRKIQRLPLQSTKELAEYIRRVLGYSNSRTHPATRAFQALRIEVNKELESIEKLLQDIPQIMHQYGKTAFISFHSLEDRLVKHAMRNWQKGKNLKENSKNKKDFHLPLHIQLHLEENNIKGFGKEVPRGGITVSQQEYENNVRSRSARLRCFEFSRNLEG